MLACVRRQLLTFLAALALPSSAATAPHIFCWVAGDPAAAKTMPVYFSGAFADACTIRQRDGIPECVGADGSPGSFATGARFRAAMAVRYGALSTVTPSCSSYDSEDTATRMIDVVAKLADLYDRSGQKIVVIKTGWVPGAATAAARSAPMVAEPVDGVTEAAALNARITAANLEVQQRNDAAKAAFDASQAQFRAAQAAYEAEVARQRSAYDEAQRRHAAELKAWQDKVAACKAGDYARCQL